MDYETTPIPINSPRYSLHCIGFQSLRNIKVDFSGFTAIVGESDVGKSAIVRAIEAVLFNEMHPSWISVGEDECRIKLTMWDHPVIRSCELIRNVKKNINEYQVTLADGKVEVHSKTGKTTPQTMLDNGIRLIETDRGQAINTNIQGQHDPVFLLSMTETQVTDLYNALFGTNRIEKALLNVNRDIQGANKEYVELQSQLASNERNLQTARDNHEVAFAQHRTISHLRQIYETNTKDCETAKQRMEELTALTAQIAKAKIEHEENTARLYIIRKLHAAITSKIRAEQLKLTVDTAAANLRKATDQINQSQIIRKKYQDLGLSLSKFANTRHVNNRLNSLVKPIAADNVNEKNSAITAALTALKALAWVKQTTRTIRDMEQPKRQGIDVPAAASKIDELSKILKRIGGTNYYVSTLQGPKQQLAKLQAAVDELRTERRAIETYEAGPLATNTGECDTCGRRIPKLNLTGNS